MQESSVYEHLVETADEERYQRGLQHGAELGQGKMPLNFFLVSLSISLILTRCVCYYRHWKILAMSMSLDNYLTQHYGPKASRRSSTL